MNVNIICSIYARRCKHYLFVCHYRVQHLIIKKGSKELYWGSFKKELCTLWKAGEAGQAQHPATRWSFEQSVLVVLEEVVLASWETVMRVATMHFTCAVYCLFVCVQC